MTWKTEGCHPRRIVPQVLSSNNTAENTVHRWPGNTTVRRKTLSLNSLEVEATRATEETMANQMKEMIVYSRDVKRAKMKIQFKLFTEQMDYQKRQGPKAGAYGK